MKGPCVRVKGRGLLRREIDLESKSVVDEDYGFSFELVAAVDPRLMAPVSLESRFSVSLVAI